MAGWSRLALALVASSASAPPVALAAEMPPSRGWLAATVSGSRDRGGDDAIRSGSLSLRGGGTLLTRTSFDRDGEPTAWGLFGRLDVRAFTTDLAVVEGEPRFFRLAPSLGAFYVSSARNVYWVEAGALVAEQGALLGAPEPHPFGRALGTYRASETVTLLYGLGYTYDFGRGLPLPFLGVGWRFAPAWRLDVLLPVVARVSWRASSEFTLALGSSVAGDWFRYRAVGEADDQLLRIARIRLGLEGRYAVSRRSHLGLEIGVEGTSIDTGLSTQTARGGYLQLSFGFNFDEGR